MSLAGTPPAGYVRMVAGRCTVITKKEHADDARILLAEGSLHDAAARDVGARVLQGRGRVYAISLPATGVRAVVRHNRHGGLFAPITRDLFLPPTRAPHELAVSLGLASLGIATPEVLMFGITRVAGALRRSDTVTREIHSSRDLSALMTPDAGEAERTSAWSAAARLVRAMGDAGVRHHDLNVKNILVSGEGARAWLLDVDRVAFHAPGDPAVHRANVARLLRSVRKWRDERGAQVNVREIALLLG